MIEQRTTTYAWAGKPGGSVSQKLRDGAVLASNFVQNPNATGSTSSLTGATATTYTGGSRARAYKATTTTASAVTFGLTTAEQPAASPGDVWWVHALIQADSTVYGARRVALTCRYRDAPGGNILGSSSTVTQDIVPQGIFHRWTGTANASTSEEYSGTTRRVNYASDPRATNPTIPTSALGWAPRWFGSGGTGTTTVVTGASDGPLGISSYSRKTWTAIGANVADVGWTHNNTGTSAYRVTAGTTITVSGYVRGSRTLSARDTNNGVLIQWMDSTGNVISNTLGTSSAPITAGQWVRYTATGTAPANTVYANIITQVYLSTDWAVGDTLDGTGLLVETGSTVGAYFDGASANTGTGNDPTVYELATQATAPAGTKYVEVAVTRQNTYSPANGDSLWITDVALIEPDDAARFYFDGDSAQSVEYVNVDRPGQITTDEWVEIDGVPLNTYAYNITSWGGARQSAPAFRGANITVPGRPGTMFQERELDSGEYAFTMWVQGVNENGSLPTDRNQALTFDRNWKRLFRLMFQLKREIKITKRWYDYDTKSVKSASAMATYNGGLDPVMTGRARAVFSPSFLLSSPFFYDDTPVALPVSSTQQKTWQTELLGDWTTTAITGSIRGPRLNPKITVTHEDGTQSWMQYSGSLVAGDSLVFDVDSYTATLTLANGTVRKVSGLISHGGGKSWLSLDPGDNTIVANSDSGNGPVSLSYLPVWF